MTEYEYEYYLVFQNDQIRIQIIFGLKNYLNTNTNNIRFEKITRIRMRIIFGLQKSPEYKYEQDKVNYAVSEREVG